MIQVGNLLEEVFPKNNIRLIAVNDNYDSSSNTDDESVVLKSFLNDYYLKECSKKSNRTMKQRSLKGNMSSRGCYGYMWNESKQIIINEETAIIVKRIFAMYLNNIGSTEIAKILTEEKVETPAHNKMKLYNQKCYKITEDKYYKWTCSTINKILLNYQYTGNSINLKTKTVNGKEVANPNPVILKNTHDPIISESDYDKCTKLRNSKATYIKSKNDYNHIRIKSLFKCSCGKSLIFEKGKKTNSYRCKNCNSYFNTNTLHEALSSDIKNLINSFNLNQKQFETRLKQIISNTDDLNNIIELEKEKNYIQNQIENLFESKIENKITKEDYLTINNELKESLIVINNELSKYDNIALDIKMFDNRLSNLKKEIKESVNISNDLDLIKHFIKECIVIKEDDSIKLKVKYKCGMKTS